MRISLANREAPQTPSALRSRKGSLLAEVAMSGVMLIIAMGVTVRVLGWVAAERRASDRRQWAVQEVANLMERLSERPYEGVTVDTAKALSLSAHASQWLPGVELEADVKENDEAGGQGSKRVALRLRWHDRSGGWDAPVRLTSWIYRRRAGK